MKIFGIQIGGSKAMSLPSSGNGGWWASLISDAERQGHPMDAWQRGISIDRNDVLSSPTLFSCLTLISSDIGKMRMDLVEKTSQGVWTKTENTAYSPVLRVPNSYQTRNQFLESWIMSKLTSGNTYVLKEYDNRQVVTAMHVLDPKRVQVMISDSGDVFYEIHQNELHGVKEHITVPARYVIHDRMNCVFHPLVGVSPIFASALSATHGLNIQKNFITLFANNSTPGGILTAPGNVTEEQAQRIKGIWENGYTGKNSGRVAFLGNGVTYTTMAQNAVDSQVIDQLNWTDHKVCSVLHVPPFKVGVGETPKYDNVNALNTEYYSTCLQSLIESLEECLDRGLGMNFKIGVQLDIDSLLRMDKAANIKMLGDAVRGSLYSPNEARLQIDQPPVAGGESPMAQQQNFSLAALAKRDAQDDPFASSGPTPAATAAAATQAQNDNSAATAVAAAKAIIRIQKGLAYDSAS